MSAIKKNCICAVCIAFCYILPLAFHGLTLGSILSPMHIPVLLCGIVCGGFYGALCGIVGPCLSSLLSGMPPASALVSMLPELCVYGLACGILMRLLRTKHLMADIYLSLIPAMLIGRIVGGIAKALLYTGSGEAYSLALWASSYLTGSLPGIIAHLVLVPLLVFTLEKAKVIPARYPDIVKQVN